MKRCQNRISGKIYYYDLRKYYFSILTWDGYILYLTDNKSFWNTMVNKEDFDRLYIDLNQLDRKNKLIKINEKRTN